MIRAILIAVLALACTADARPQRYAIGQRDQLTKGLVAYWSMRNSGTTVYDEMGANNGTAIGGAAFAYTNGVVGNGVRLDGSDDYIQVADNDSLDMNQITISFWIKGNSYTLKGIMSKRIAFDNNNSWNFYAGSTSTVRYQVTTDGSTPISITTSTALSGGGLYHIVGTSNGSSLNIYVNGKVDATPVSFANNIYSGTANIAIGNLYPSLFFPGTIDEVRIYNRALTADEIKQLYRMGRTIYNNR